MGKSRLEAFSDGVIAILITIMVLELRVPHGETAEALRPVLLVLLMAAIAYYVLQNLIIASQGEDSLLRRAVGGDWKGKLSPALYLLAIGTAFVSQWLSLAIYAAVAVIWFVPDRRIERVLVHKEG